MRVMKWIGGVLVALWVVAALTAFAFLYVPGGYDARLASVERQAQRGVDRGQWSGVMWAVVEPGAVLETGAAGFADIDAGLEMTPETIMPIGSISKVVTGLVAAQAVLDGAVDENAPITDYLSIPFDPPDGVDRTLVQLATHTAALTDLDPVYEGHAYHMDGVVHPDSLGRFLTRALSQRGDLYDADTFIPTEPGSYYSYSNIGAGLAAQVVQDATGEDFVDATQQIVIDPFGLSGFWGHRAPPAAQVATLYGRDEQGRFVPLAPYGLATWPDGQFNASAQDLARMLAALLNDGTLEGEQLLQQDLVDTLTVPRVTGIAGLESETDFVGFFWTRETISFGPMTLDLEGHSGGDPGVFTMMYRAADSPTGFVVMINSDPNSLIDVLAMVRLIRTLAGMPAKG